MSQFDLLIIGAGPAGSFAAELLAKGGARVALFGRKINLAESQLDIMRFMRAVADCSPLGYSLYEFPLTSRATWKALTTPLAAARRGGTC